MHAREDWVVFAKDGFILGTTQKHKGAEGKSFCEKNRVVLRRFADVDRATRLLAMNRGVFHGAE